MSTSSPIPKGDDLRRAIVWLAEQGSPRTLDLIEQACQRFDLSPADEDFLIREFHRQRERGEL